MADEKRTRPMSFSSETVVQRWYGGEKLDHTAGSARMDFLNSGRAPLLLGHDMRDQVGVIEAASISPDKVGRGTVRFGRSSAAEDAIKDVDDGIMTNTSVGYRIHEMILESRSDDIEVYRMTDWEPYEVSLVSVPADQSVGMNRNLEEVRKVPITEAVAPNIPEKQENESIEPRQERGSSVLEPEDLKHPPINGNQGATMTQKANAAADNSADETSNETRGTVLEQARGPSVQDMEKGRISAINNMCQACNINDEGMKRQWISAGTSVSDVSEDIMRIVASRADQNKKSNVAQLDLSVSDTRRFSIVRAVLAAAQGDWKDAGFEAECSREISKRLNAVPDSKKFYVPYDIQSRGIDPRAIASSERALVGGDLKGSRYTRADIVGTAAVGGYLVQTTNQDFISLLRNRAVAYRMGATQLSGLQGNVNVPKQTGSATAAWLGSETTQIGETEQAFGQLSLTPHTVGAYTEVSRLLLLQSSPGIEGIVNADLAAVAALAVDSGVLVGSGTGGQPTGIKNVAGVGTAAAGDMATIAYQGILDYQVAVATANVVPARGGYVTTPTVASKLMNRTKFPNTATPLWDGNLWDANGDAGVGGFPGMSTNQMPAGAMYFGDWASVIVAEWGVLEITTNPYANFQANIIGIKAVMTIDVGLRYPAAFCIQGASIT